MRDFDDAKDKVQLGPERRSLVMTEEEQAPRPTTRRGTRWSPG